MGYDLKAEVSPIFLSGASATGATKVKYKADHPITLWRRLNGAPWQPENLLDVLPPGASTEAIRDVQMGGKRKTPDLNPGDWVEYGMLAEYSLDPNKPGFSFKNFLAYIVIDALLGQSRLSVDGPDSGLFPGGTFVRKRVATIKPTRVRMQVGLNAPQPVTYTGTPVSNGFLTMPDATAEHFDADLNSLLMLHDFEVAPLVSGTRYFALTLLIGRGGDWEIKEEPFRTKQRKVTLQFKKFSVFNDGDESPWGDGDRVQIWFSVFRGDRMFAEQYWGPSPDQLASIVWYGHDISDEPGRNVVNLNFEDVVIGPEELNGNDPGLGISVFAREHDTFSTDEAEPRADYAPDPSVYGQLEGKIIKRVPLPTGSAKERISPAPGVPNTEVSAWPKWYDNSYDGDLAITAHVRYVVEYL